MPFWSAPVQMEEADAVPLEIPNEQSLPDHFFFLCSSSLGQRRTTYTVNQFNNLNDYINFMK